MIRVAYIINEQLNKSADTRCALSRADFSRQRDVYILAKRKRAECVRLWNEFAAEQPAMARLVVADVEQQKAMDQAANRHLDKVLVKSEKPKKITKAQKREIMKTPPLTPEQRAGLAFINSDDPAERMAARKLLESV